MVHNYTSLSSNTTVEFSQNSGKKIDSNSNSKSMKTSWFAMILMLLSLTIGQKTWAQSSVNYLPTPTTVATGTNASLALDMNANAVDMSTGTTSLVGTASDSGVSSVNSIGFNFVFMGNLYTQYSASANGLFQLGSSSVSGTSYLVSGGTTASPKFGPIISDAATASSSDGGGVTAKLIGTAPNRCLVIQWVSYLHYSNTSLPATFQARLYETSGVLEYVYGSMPVGANAYGAYYTGFSTNSTDNSYANITTSTNACSTTSFPANTYTVNTNIANLDSSVNGSRRYYRFIPPTGIPADPITLTFTPITAIATTPNWVDNSTTESYFIVTRATDAAFTTNVVTTSVPSTTRAGTGTTYTSAQTGLSPNTTYYYKIQAGHEASALSTGLTGSQATTPPATISSVPAGGPWNVGATWVGGNVPSAFDNVVIVDGATVTVNTTSAVAYSLTVGSGSGSSAILDYDSTSTAKTLTVSQSVTINNNGIVRSNTTGTANHTLSVGTDFAINGAGVFNGGFSATSKLNITFTGAANNTFTTSATSVVTFNTVTINKGTAIANTLEFIPGAVFTAPATGFLAITNGTFKLSGSITQSNILFNATGYTIPALGGFWLNNPNFTVTGQAGSPTMSGLLRLSAGTFNVGTLAAHIMGGATTSQFVIDGGTLNIAARLVVTNAGASFIMSSGIVNVTTVANSTTASPGFGFTSATSVFNMSGGTINLVQRNTGATVLDYNVATTAPVITGGTLNVGTSTTATNFNFGIQGAIPNLVIDGTTTNKTAQLAGAATVYLNTTINSASGVLGTLNTQGNVITFRGSVTNNGTVTANATNAGITFQGSAAQTLGGTITAGQIANLTVNNTAGATITPSVQINSGLALTAGQLSSGGTLTLGAGAATTFTFISSGGTLGGSVTKTYGTGTTSFTYNGTTAQNTGLEIPTSITTGSLTINNAGGVTLNSPFTVPTVNLTAGKLTTSSTNLLTVSGTAVGSISTGSATAYVVGPLARTLPIASSGNTYVFPVGKAAYQLFEMISPTNSVANAVVTVEAFDSAIATPGGFASLTNQRYWKVSPITGGTFTAPGTVRLTETGLTSGSRIGQSVATSETGTYDNIGAGTITLGTPGTITNSLTLPAYGTGANSTFFVTGLPSALVAGIYAVGPTASSSTTQPGGALYDGFYNSLTAAMNAASAAGSATSHIIFELQNDIASGTETYPISTNFQGTATATLTIRPRSDNATALTLSGTSASQLIDLNGAKYIIIDGRPGSTGTNNRLIIANTSATAAASTVRFINDAQNNTITYTTLQGASTTAATGTVFFGAGTVNGNDNNNINNSTITSLTSTFPVNGIYSVAASSLVDNSNNTLDSNIISDYFSATVATNGIYLNSPGNSAWTITNNRLFQSATRLYTSANTHNAINIQTGFGYTINGNTIGYGSASGPGTTTNMVGNSLALGGTFPGAYTLTGSSNNTLFRGMNLTFSAGTASEIQSNKIAGIALYTGANSGNDSFIGILVTSGNANIGTTTGNIIGETAGQSSIYVANNSTSGAYVVGMRIASSNTVTIQNNTIGAIDVSGTSASSASPLVPIALFGSGTTCVYTVTSNNIGNVTANNIRSGYFLSGANLSNNVLTPTLTSGAGLITGIQATTFTGNALTISNNIFRGWQAGSGTGAVTGITATGTLTGTTPSTNTNSNSFGTASTDWVTYPFANNGALTGISVTNTAGVINNINTNDFRRIVYTAPGAGSHTYINFTGGTAASNVSSISNNTFTNLNADTSGNINFIAHGYSVVATGTQTINNNSIVTAFQKLTAGGTITLAASASSSTAGAIINHTNNNFSNITINGNTTIAGWISTDGGSANKNYTGNTFNNWQAGTGTGSITGMSVSFGGGNAGLGNNISGNTITNFSSAGNITGLNIGSSGTLHTAFNNTIGGFTSSGASATVNGIVINGALGTNVYRNKIYDLSATGATPLVSGIIVGGSTSASTQNVYNNIIGNLTAANGSNGTTDVVRGINITSTASTTSINVINNTIRLSGGGGTNFSASGIFHTGSTTATTAALNLRNNIVINLTTPSGTGLVSALRRSASGLLANFASTSNKNLLFAGAPSATRLIMADGTNAYQTLAAYQAAVGSPKEITSFTGETTFDYSAVTGGTQFFQSITGSDATFLHSLAGITTQVEGGADPITTPDVSKDFDDEVRNATKPDVGADEFAGVSPTPVVTIITSPTGVCTATSHTVAATVVPTAGTVSSVLLNYSFNGVAGAGSPVTMTTLDNITWTGAIPAATPANAKVTWGVTGTNSIGISASAIGTIYSDSPNTGVVLGTNITTAGVCPGSSVTLTATGLSSSAALGTYIDPPKVTNPTTDEDLANITITQGATTILNNTSTINSLTGTIGTATGTAGDYSNFTSFGPYTLASGGTYNISVTSSTTGTSYTNLMSVWIDYNRNGSFADAGEQVFLSTSGSGAITRTGSFTVPAGTSFGTTRMRVVDFEGSAITGSDMVVGYGEYEEYSINLVAGTLTYAWSDGTNNVGNTASISPTPTGNTNYTVSTTLNGCPLSSAPVVVTLNTTPTAPVGTDSVQCGVGNPGASVSDPNLFGATRLFRWYDTATKTTLLQSSISTTYTTSISATKHFWVTVTNPTTGCESAVTEVVANVNAPDAVAASSSDFPSVCMTSAGTPVHLTATTTESTNGNVYVVTWTSTAGSGITTSQAGGTTTFGTPTSTTVTPTVAGTYDYTATAVDSTLGCTTISKVTVIVKPQPVITITPAAPAIFCPNTPITLTATTPTAGVNTVALGAGSSTSSSESGTMFPGAYGGSKTQYVIRASELTALGVSAGNITSLAFEATNSGQAYPNFALSVGATASANITTASGFRSSAVTQLYSNASFTPVIGVNTLTFTSPFVWDGTSNILLSFCWSSGLTTSTSTTVKTDTAAFNCTYGWRKDSTTAAAICAVTGVQADGSSSSASTTRPKFIFGANVTSAGGLNYSWNTIPTATLSNVLTFSPTTGGTYTVTATDPTSTCSGTKDVVLTVHPIVTPPTFSGTLTQCGTKIPLAATLSIADPNAFTTPTFKWYADATTTTTLQSSTATTYASNVSASRDFYVSIVSPVTSCESTRTLIHFDVVTPTPVVITSGSAGTPIARTGITCLGDQLTLEATGSYPTKNWTVSPNTGGGFTGSLSGNTSQTITPTVAGTYTYTFSSDDGNCTSLGTLIVTVSAKPIVNIVPANPSICAGGSTTLTAGSIIPQTSIAVGAGASTSAILTPYRTGNAFVKQQYLYTAAELNAAGIYAGNITSLSFFVTALGSPTALTNFQISMAQTTTTALSTTDFDTTASTVVYGPTSYTVVLNANTHTLTTPFAWNGTSNIVITMCNETVAPVTSATGKYDTITGRVVTGIGSTSSICGVTTGGTVQGGRPTITFAGSNMYTTGPALTYSWNTTPVTTSAAAIVSPTVNNTSYTVTGTATTTCSSTASVSVSINPLPTMPTTTGTLSQCGAGVPSAAALTVVDPNGYTTPTFKWYIDNTTTTTLQSSTATKYNGTISGATTLYVSVVNPVTLCESTRRAVTITFITAPTVAITSPKSIFCGTGGTTSLTAVATGDSGMTFSWTSSPASAVINSGAAAATLNVTVTETSVFHLTGTPSISTCGNVLKDFTVSVYPLPDASITSTLGTGICPGSTTILGSGLVAGNFASAAIPFAPLTATSDAVTLVQDSVINVNPDLSFSSSTDLDDAGWSNIPINFPFSFFGNDYTTVSIGTNGTVFMGTASTANVEDYSFLTLPSTTEPFNMIAVLAMDNNLSTSTGGAIKYWTEGVEPNRKFVVSYEAVKEHADTKYSTAQAIFYETTGVVEVHVTSSTNVDRNKLVGINNGDGTIGVLAYASGTSTSTPANNPIATSFAYRFSPPINYNVTWSYKNSTTSGNFAQLSTGTNLFTQSVLPTETTTYQLSYTNQTTGCANDPASDQIVISILSDVAPTNITTTSSVASVCLGSSTTLGLTPGVGSTLSGLTYQWEVSTDNGDNYTNIASATSATVSVSPTVLTNKYRCRVLRCTGTVPAYSSAITIPFTNNVTNAPDVTRCGTGAVTLNATATGSTGAIIKWYDAATGGNLLFTGTDATTPYPIASISAASTTFYAVSESASPTCLSPRKPVIVTVTTPDALTISEGASTTICYNATTPQTITLVGGSAYNNFTWNTTTPAVSTVTAGVSYSVLPTTTTNYTLTATQNTGRQCSIVVPFTINVNDVNVTAIASPVASESVPVCPGTSVTLTANSFVSGPSGLPATYCVPGQTDSTSTSRISNVTFNTLSNTDAQTGALYNIYPATGTNTTAVTAGSTYSLSVVTGASSIVSVWIDYNRNGNFQAAEWQQVNTSGTTGSINITIPSTATPGQTAMRIRSRDTGNTNGASNDCTSFASGSCKDFTIQIQQNNSALYTYAWTKGSDTTVLSSLATYGITPQETADYTVTATSIIGGCTKSSKVTVNVSSHFIPAISSGNVTAMCLGTPTIPNGIHFSLVNPTIEQEPVTWISSNPAVATIDPGNGDLTGLTVGFTDIRARIIDPVTHCESYSPNTIRVNIYAPVVITSQPIDKNIISNGSTKFKVAASGSGPGVGGTITYQWYVSSQNNNIGDPLTALDTYVTGITTNEITVTDENGILNDKYFTCLITGSSPCDTPVPSDTVRLRVNDLKLINPEPKSICHPFETSTTFTANTNLELPVAETSTANNLVVWSANNGVNNTYTDVTSGTQTINGVTLTFTPSTAPTSTAGESTLSLLVEGLTPATNGWRFKVKVYDDNSETEILSGAGILTVNTQAVITTSVNNPTLTTPVVKSVCHTGGSTSFTVNATNTTGVYQWQYSATDSTNDADWTNITANLTTGATYSTFTTATLNILTTSTLTNVDRYYRALVGSTGVCGPVKTLAYKMTVNTPNVAITPPSSLTYCYPGGTAIALTATGASTYAWAANPSGVTAGITGSGVSITVSPTVTTTYTVTGTDATGCSNTAQVTITILRGVTTAATATPQVVCSGALVQLNAGTTILTTGTPSTYTLAGSTGTYSAITGTPAAAIGDDRGEGSLPIGFSFSYNGTVQTVFGVSSNGFIELGSTVTYTANGTGSTGAGWTTSNNLLSGRANIIAPFWEDNNTSGGSVSYATTGTPGSRVLTVQWSGMHVGLSGNAAQPTINAQVKLYEGSNKIEYVYGATSTALTSTTASIGLSGAVGNYLSVTPLNPASTSSTSNSSENTSISSANNIPSGTTYTFTPSSKIGVPGTGEVTYAWTSTETVSTLTGATLVNPTAHPTANATYEVTATAASSGCAAVSHVDVSIQSGATLTDSPKAATKCVGESVTFTVAATGPGLTYEWFKSPSTTPISGQSAATYTIPAVALTDAGSYYVVVTPLCGAPMPTTPVALAVNPFPTATIALTSGTGSVCENDAAPSVTFTGAGVGTTPPYTFTYNINGGANQTVVSTGTTAVVTNSTTTSGVYTYNLVSVKDNSFTNCSQVQSGSVTITVSPKPTGVTVSPNAQINCSNGNAILLTAVGGITELASAASGTGTSINTTTSANDAYPAPYGGYFENTKQQYLFRAADLTAMGLTSGASIKSITFDVTTLGTSGLHKAYTISIGNTAQTALATWVTPVTPVYGPTDYQPVTGANKHTFTTPFVWTGGNIVIQICHSNDPTGSAGTAFTVNAQSKYSTTAYNSSLIYRVDSAEACGSNSITTGYTPTKRPNMIFGYDGQGTVNWSSTVTNSFTNATAGAFTSTASGLTTYVRPSATATITAKVTSLAGCISQGTSAITVNQPPTASVTNNTPICPGTTATFTLTGTAGAIVTYNINGTGGNLTATLTGGTATVNVTNANATQTLNLVSINNPATGCSQTLTGNSVVTLNSISIAPTGISGTTTVCTGTGTTLTAIGGTAGTGATLEWHTGSCSGPSAGTGNSISPTNITAQTTYYVNYIGTCNTTTCASVVVNVTPNNTATLTSAPGTNTTQQVFVNDAITNITYTTTGATGISNNGVSGANGLPNGVKASWTANTLTISGTPIIDSGTFNYSIALTGGCGIVTVQGVIVVKPQSYWYLDHDGDHYYSDYVLSGTAPSIYHTQTGLLGDGDCDDNNANIHPNATEIWFNNIDENCVGGNSDGHAPVVVNITTASGNLALMTTPINCSVATNTAGNFGNSTGVKYRFQVSKTSGIPSVAYVTSSTTSFAISSASNAAHSSTYDVTATAVVYILPNGQEEEQPYAGNTRTFVTPMAPTIPLTTQTGAPNAPCAYTLAKIDSYIYANNSTTYGSTKFEFTVERVGASPAEIVTVGTSGPYFRLTAMPGVPASIQVLYGATYKVKVRYGYDSYGSAVWSNYGSDCLVTTPALAVPAVTCGPLASINAYLYASGATPGANLYEFKVTRVSAPAQGELAISPPGNTEEVVPRTVNNFKLSMLTTLFLGLQKEYNVSVRYRINSYGTQQFSGWSAVNCPVYTPDFPATMLIDEQCDQPGVPSTLTQYIYSYNAPGATSYRFRLTKVGTTLSPQTYDYTVESPDRYVKLIEFPGLTAGFRYSISVVAVLYGETASWISVKECSLIAPASTPVGPTKDVVLTKFQATAYPNPFATNFLIDVKTSSQSIVNLKVYDMIGRLIEQRDVRPSDMSGAAIGERYPSGVYNVVVSQGEDVQTVRVVKR